MALNDMKVVVVNIFCKREVTVDSCSINVDSGNIIIKGELNNEQYGAYALRVISPRAPNKTIVQITPQHITPANISNKIRPFTAIFNNIGRLLEDPEPKNIEIYIRVKPDMIPYNKIFSDKIRFEDLTLGAVVPLMSFPSDREKKEERRQDAKDEKAAKENLTALADYERRKDEEKKRRMKIDGYAYANKDGMDEIQEETMKILTHLKMKVVLIRVVNTLTLKLIKAKMSQVKIIICQVKKLKIMKENYKI